MSHNLFNSHTTMTNKDVGKLCHIWQNLQNTITIKPIRSNEEYEQALRLIETFLQAEEEKSSSLVDLIEILGILINNYEAENIQIGHANPAEVLAFLMAEHGLQQKDLPEIGSQGVVSEILSSKRELNKRQIITLAARFGVSPSVFI